MVKNKEKGTEIGGFSASFLAWACQALRRAPKVNGTILAVTPGEDGS